ncbi:Rv0361 family membrane protein [Gordonia sp. (in: high G+C Gram-positive bacteria)]|uniref:Rv0361 family membrane protein n=1 Tax=Gordonia sp. (in: high G+C Gram-positive bacteria) TaxID=84139 RepID=UPI003F9D26D3
MATQSNAPDTGRSAPDRRRRLAALGIAALCVLAVIVGGYAIYRAATSGDGPKSDTEQVEAQARGYLGDMSRGDLRGASERMCQALGPVVSGGGGVPDLPTGGNETRKAEIVVDDVTITGDSASVAGVLRYGSTTTDIPMTLRRESDGWCITDVQ